MQGLRILTASEQVAAHLREALVRGFWNAQVPGVNGLARDLGVANETVETALRLLEREGLLVGQGPGRRRRIVIPEGAIEATPLRVGLLVNDFDRLADELYHLHDSLPEAVEAEKKFNFLAADDFADGFHGALAAGALERVAAPNLEDEVAPEGAHVAGGLFRWCGDEKDLRLMIVDFGLLI